MSEKNVAPVPDANRINIESRAYQIWENEGRPVDSALDHWLRAEAEAVSIHSETKGKQTRRKGAKAATKS